MAGNEDHAVGESSNAQTPSAGPSRLRKAAFSLIILVMALGLAEGAAHLALAVFSGTDHRERLPWYADHDWAEDYWTEFNELAVRYESYVGWRRGDYAGDFINIRNGERVVPTNPPRHEDSLEAWCFGGSTLWGTGARDAYAIPSILARLAAEQGLNVNVRNLGESGWCTTQGMIWLTLKCRSGEIPDIVLFYSGVNDVFSAYQSGRGDGSHQNLSTWEAYLETGVDPRRRWVRRLGLVRCTEALLGRLGKRNVKNRTITSPGGNDSTDPLAGDVARVFVENMSFVRSLGDTYGFESLFFWQPIVANQDDYEKRERQVRARFDRKYFDLYERCRAAVMAFDIHPIDLTGCLGPSPELGFFIDHVHLNEDGNTRIAEAIFPHLQASVDQLRGRSARR